MEFMADFLVHFIVLLLNKHMIPPQNMLFKWTQVIFSVLFDHDVVEIMIEKNFITIFLFERNCIWKQNIEMPLTASIAFINLFVCSINGLEQWNQLETVSTNR